MFSVFWDVITVVYRIKTDLLTISPAVWRGDDIVRRNARLAARYAVSWTPVAC